MESNAENLWKLSYRVCSHEPVGQGWSSGKLFEALQIEEIICIKMESVCLDSITVKVHPNGTGALKKQGSKSSADYEADSQSKFIGSPRLTVRL